MKLPTWGWILLSGICAGGAGYTARGPVAGVLGCGYAMLATRTALRWSAARHAHRHRVEALDAVTCLAADLRAGLTPGMALSANLGQLGVVPGDTSQEGGKPAQEGGKPAQEPVLKRLRVGMRFAEVTGAPLADILDLTVADLHAEQRHVAQCMAHTAGARATTAILTFLPLVGIGWGYAIGGDPVRVLLDTPTGGACACGALLLQTVGLLWTGRLVRHAAT